MTEKPIFGMSSRESEYDEYKKHWVVLYSKTNRNYAGKVDEISNGNMVLNPFQSGEYDEEGNLNRRLTKGRTKIRLVSIECVEPTTRKNIECFCAYKNKQMAQQKLSDKETNHHSIKK